MGAWSSSGVIHAKVDFEEYDQVMYYDASKSKFNCTGNLRAVRDYITA